MKKYIAILIPLLLISSLLCSQTKYQKETYTYASKDGKDLLLDKYDREDTIQNKPCVIFMFGGGFVKGERDRSQYLPYFNSLVENGNIVISIDYRKGFSNVKSLTTANTSEQDFVKLFYHTLTIATEDLLDATNYILKNAKDWQIDRNKIVVSGSSSGAVTALHGEYAIINQSEVAQRLPSDFRYAGVISFAGAIFSMHGDLKWKESPAPMLLFHGSADKQVPYNAVELGYLGFYGSKYIYKQLDNMNIPYYFYDEEYGDHSLASSPMKEQLELINDFIREEVVSKRGRRTHTFVKVNGRAAVNTHFSVKDYILANYPSR